jgi:hypothetical protein
MSTPPPSDDALAPSSPPAVPAGLVFTPEGGERVCAAYSPAFKLLALGLLAAAGLWAWQMYQWNQQQAIPQHAFWLLAPWGLMAYTVGFVVLGVTRFNAEGIEQSWMWRKHVALKDLAYVKVIRVRGMEWLIAPRLYTKTFGGKLFIFYAADPAMLAEFKRLEQALDGLRNPG